MRARAVICREVDRPVVVEEIEVDGPGPGETLVDSRFRTVPGFPPRTVPGFPPCGNGKPNS